MVESELAAGSIDVDLRLTAGGGVLSAGDPNGCEPLAEVFGHNLHAIEPYATKVSGLPENIRAVITGSPSVQYGPGTLYILTRPALAGGPTSEGSDLPA